MNGLHCDGDQNNAATSNSLSNHATNGSLSHGAAMEEESEAQSRLGPADRDIIRIIIQHLRSLNLKYVV